MNRVYTITFTEGPNVPLVTATAARLSAAGVPVQDQGGQSVSFRVTGATPGERDYGAVYAAEEAMAGRPEAWELATGLGLHRRVVETSAAVTR